MADLDHFKQINDSLGHLTGDRVLQEAARRMVASIRPYDGVGRYGGEEFLAILPGCDGTTSSALAERLRCTMAREPVELGSVQIQVTLSLGVAAWHGCGDGLSLLLTADEALYRAKRSGRNRTELGSKPDF